MKLAPITATLAIGLAATALLAPHANAANARNPYGNVNKGNDAGNPTGDDKVDQLNSMQLNQNYWDAAKKPGAVPNPPTTYIVPPDGTPRPVR